MKREEVEKQNEAAVRLAKEKKQMKLDELEDNSTKRLTEATLQEFGLLEAVLKQLQVLGAQLEVKRLSRTGSTPHLL